MGTKIIGSQANVGASGIQKAMKGAKKGRQAETHTHIEIGRPKEEIFCPSHSFCFIIMEA